MKKYSNKNVNKNFLGIVNMYKLSFGKRCDLICKNQIIKRNYPGGMEKFLSIKEKGFIVTKIYGQIVKKGNIKEKVISSKKDGYFAKVYVEEKESLLNLENIKVAFLSRNLVHIERNLKNYSDALTFNSKLDLELEEQNSIELKHDVIVESTEDGIVALESGIASNVGLKYGILTSAHSVKKVKCTNMEGYYVEDEIIPVKLGGKIHGMKDSVYIAKIGETTVTDLHERGYNFEYRKVLNIEQVQSILGVDFEIFDKEGFTGLLHEKNLDSQFFGELDISKNAVILNIASKINN